MVAHLYRLAQQKLRYEIVKDRNCNFEVKILLFLCKIAIFFSILGLRSQTHIASCGWVLCPQTSIASGGWVLHPQSPMASGRFTHGSSVGFSKLALYSNLFSSYVIWRGSNIHQKIIVFGSPESYSLSNFTGLNCGVNADSYFSWYFMFCYISNLLFSHLLF